MNLFNKNKAIKRYVRSHIVNSVPYSSALKNISSFNICKPVGISITRAKGSRFCLAVDYLCVFKTM